jgi:hypothetical protein
VPRPPGAAGAQQLAEIAHHRLGAHDPRAALPAALRAARAAEEVHALAEAARNYDAILELWDALEDPEDLTGIDLPLVLERAAECRWAGVSDARPRSMPCVRPSPD